MSVQLSHPHPSIDYQLKHGGTVTIPAHTQAVLCKSAIAMQNRQSLEPQSFTLQFQNGDRREYQIKVDHRGYAEWGMKDLFRIPSDWFSYRAIDANDAIYSYLGTAQLRFEINKSKQTNQARSS